MSGVNRQRPIDRPVATLAAGVLLVLAMTTVHAGSQAAPSTQKTRIAIVGLDHDHVWSLLKDITGEPLAELVAIAESDTALVSRAQKEVPAGVKFYSDYVQMLDEAKPEGVIVATANDRHLEILRQCAKRHIHYSTEKPMATTAADAREMERLATAANIKLMVNYVHTWSDFREAHPQFGQDDFDEVLLRLQIIF